MPPKKPAPRVRRVPRRVPPPPPEVVEVGEVVPPTTGPPQPPAQISWVEWYNSASPEDQRWFDNAASVIDNGGAPYQRGGSQEQYVDNWKSRGEAFYNALVNYRDTGGRRAYFAVPPKDYGKLPISVVQKGGPIEPLTKDMVVLHPGRYTYTDVTANGPAFRQWLAVVTRPEPGQVITPVTIGQTQVSAGVLPGQDPYYIDYEFTVAKDVAWPSMVNGSPLHGFPTWLPMSINIVDYWGQVTSSKPDWLAPVHGLEWAGEQAKGLATSLGTLAALIGLAVVVYKIQPTPRESSK